MINLIKKCRARGNKIIIEETLPNPNDTYVGRSLHFKHQLFSLFSPSQIDTNVSHIIKPFSKSLSKTAQSSKSSFSLLIHLFTTLYSTCYSCLSILTYI